LKFALNAPNMITLSRLILIFVIIYMAFANYPRLAIAIVFGIAAFTDYFDGLVARKFKQTTAMGARLDQVIDRIFTVTIILALILWFSKGGTAGRNSILMLFLISSREIVALPGIIIRVIRAKDLYEVRFIGKITCWFQGFALAFIIAGFSFSIYFAVLACGVGIVSGFDYLKRSFM